MKTVYRILVVLCVMLLTQACSSPPRNRGEIFDIRNRAETQLELGNRQADRGDPGAALFLIDEAMRLAVLADDSGLRIRVGLSRSNVFFSMGRTEEAEAGWNAALDEALLSGNRELVALSRVHVARGRLLSPGGGVAAQAVIDEVTRETAFLRDRLSIAFAWTVVGLAEGELGRFDRAEIAVRRSLETHERNGYFELAAFDWFMIASFRSRSGNTDGARQALEASIVLDRRVENSWGVASSWRALGDVERRAGNLEAARAAYFRAADIFRALGNGQLAEDTMLRIGEAVND